MMLCDKCLSPVYSDQLSDGDSESDRLGTDNSESVNNLSQPFLDKTNIDLKKVANMMQFAPSTAQLEQRRRFLLRKFNELSPTARIPLDILIEIFQIACKPVYDGYRSKQAVTPLFIGSICRLWRDIAWSTPLLWSTIFLDISREHHDTQIELLRNWLLNARSAPLRIKLTMEDKHISVLNAFVTIVGILVTRSDQWLTFESCLPLPECHSIFKNVNFAMLTSVLLHCPSSYSSPIVPEMFLTAPKLFDITLRGYAFSVVLPWEQLRHLRTGRSSVDRCLKILQQSPNLQECHFGGVYLSHGVFSGAIGPLEYTHLTQLKLLNVKFDKIGCMSLFDSMTLPSLSNLYIQNYRTISLPLSSITSLFLRSACNLERLSIRSSFDDKDLIKCLNTIPSLTYLYLEVMGDPPAGIGLTRRLVASLDPLSNSRLLLPNLECFKFKGPVLCDCHTIVDMLAHRWHLLSDDGETSQSFFVPKVSKLKLAEVISIDPYHITDDVHDELRKLSEEGMSVNIKSLTLIPMELVDF